MVVGALAIARLEWYFVIYYLKHVLRSDGVEGWNKRGRNSDLCSIGAQRIGELRDEHV